MKNYIYVEGVGTIISTAAQMNVGGSDGGAHGSTYLSITQAEDLVRSLADLVGIELAPQAPQEKPFDYKDADHFATDSLHRYAVIEYLHEEFADHPDLPRILEDLTYQSRIGKALVASGTDYEPVEAPAFLKARGISQVNAYDPSAIYRAVKADPWHGYQNTKNPKAA